MRGLNKQLYVSLLFLIWLSVLCYCNGYSQKGFSEDSLRKCYTEYSFDLVSGKTMAHFGRWATPFNERSQELCADDWKKLKSAQLVSSTESIPDIFDVEYKTSLKGAELSGYLEIDFNDEGGLFILDIHKKKVFVFDQNFKFKKSFGSEAGFRNVSDLIVEGGKVYVSDPYLEKITVFSEDGKLFQDIAVINQAVDMIVVEENLCTHTGGAIPRKGNIITCYDLESGEITNDLLERTERMSRMPWGTSNTTVSTIQEFKGQIFTLNHPMEGVISIFDKEGGLYTAFTIENEIYQLPDFPKEYEVLRDLPFNFMQSLIHGIHVFKDQIMVVLVESETGIKYLDFYDFEGDRLVNELIEVGRFWPIYNDQEGNVYSFLFSEADSSYILNKYKYLK